MAQPTVPPTLDVIAIGNAIIDVIANCNDALIEELGLSRGGMMLIDADQATSLYEAMGPAREISGGSAANTLAGLAALGAKCAFIGQVAEDQLGEVFTHDIRAGGIAFDVPARPGNPPTARCLIFVTPDGQRTMNTFLGASHYLPAKRLTKARSPVPPCFTSKAISGIRKSRALRCARPSTRPARPVARSPSRLRNAS